MTVTETESWTAAFRSSPVGPHEELTFGRPSRSFAGRTVRQVVPAHRAGDRLRIRLGNLFGAQPLVIAHTAVAVHDRGSAVVEGSSTPVTFGGAPSVRITPGTEAVSDPVAFPPGSGSGLVVSGYLPGPTGRGDCHPFALRTGYLADGDHVHARRLPGAEEFRSRFHLSGIDVATPPGHRVVALFGDSLTDGVGTTDDADRRYPDHLARRLRTAGMSVVNLGIAGNRLLSDGFGECGSSRLDREVFATPGVTHVVVQLGLNDILTPGTCGPPGTTEAAITAGLAGVAERARRHGLRVLVATVTPFGGAATVSPVFDASGSETVRQRVNRWIRSGHGTLFDAVVDFDRGLADPGTPATLRPEYDSGDHLHPNDAGAEVLAELVHRALPR